MFGLSPAVRTLVIVNAVIFAVGSLVPDIGHRILELFAFWFPRNEHFAWWQVVTYMFLHGSIGHIFFNMFALVSFGVPLEAQWGSRRFLIFYFLCGIGAGLIHTTVSWLEYQSMYRDLIAAGLSSSSIEKALHTGSYVGQPPSAATTKILGELYHVYAAPMLGASGAIYGVLVAFGLLYPNARLALLFLPVPIAAKFFIPVIIGLDLFSGLTGFSLFGGGVAHFAHVGGALIGFVLMWHWRNVARRRFSRSV